MKEVRTVQGPGGKYSVHPLIATPYSLVEECVTPWRISADGCVYAECEHYVTLTDWKVSPDDR
jgi:hypothetical protein